MRTATPAALALALVTTLAGCSTAAAPTQLAAAKPAAAQPNYKLRDWTDPLVIAQYNHTDPNLTSPTAQACFAHLDAIGWTLGGGICDQTIVYTDPTAEVIWHTTQEVGVNTDGMHVHLENTDQSNKVFGEDVDWGLSSFENTNFTNARFEGISGMRYCNFNKANLTNAYFEGFTRMEANNFSVATLTNTDFSSCVMDPYTDSTGKRWVTNFSGCDLRTAKLEGVQLTYAYMAGANLSGATQKTMNLTGAVLTGASLARLNAISCNFTNVDFTNADLQGADLSTCTLTGATFTNAKVLGAKFPAGFTPTGVADQTAPALLTITATTPGLRALSLKFTTDDAASVKVAYGPTKALGSQATVAQPPTPTLKSFSTSFPCSASTVYYTITTTDALGNTATTPVRSAAIRL